MPACDTLSWPDMYVYQIPSTYAKGSKSYGVHKVSTTKFINGRKPGRTTIFSWTSYICLSIISKYLKGYGRY